MIAQNPSTIREVFSLYLQYAPDLARKTVQKMGYEIKRWETLLGPLHVEEIASEHFAVFRRLGLQHNLSPNSIETNIGTVLTLLRFARNVLAIIDAVPPAGRPLRRRRTKPRYLDGDELGKLYRSTHVTNWPRTHVRPRVFWRCWLVVSFFTGLRLEDQMHNLDWSEIDDTMIRVVAKKTGKEHCFPMHPVLAEHVEQMRGGRMERLFPCSKSPHLVRRELAKISEEANVRPHVTPQHLRQTAGTHWERAKTGAGQLLLGHTLGVSGRYIHVPELLIEAAERLDVPREFGLPDLGRQLTLF